jgi:sugar phosphate isomerase/epimerase
MDDTSESVRGKMRVFRGKYAFSSLGCSQFELDDVIALAARHGIECVELRTLAGSADLPGYFAARYGSPEHLGLHMRDAALSIVSFGTSLRLVGNEEADRAALLAYVSWAEACGVETLRVFDGGANGTDDELEQALATWHWWSAMRAARGWRVDLAIETHDAFAHEAPLLRLLEALPDCPILWDAHHTWRKGGADPVRTWRLLRDRVKHIHVKDSVPDARAKAGYSYVLPGAGQFPMFELMSVLREDGYEGVLSLEWERHWHPALPALEEALSTARQHDWW